jgi:hypothetical protein
MARTRLWYLRHAPRVAFAVAKDPVEAWIRLQARLAERREHGRTPCRYEAEPDWERRLHDIFGIRWPCEASAQFWPLWHEVIGGLADRGLHVGPASYGIWNDGEPELVRAIWCLMHHLRPAKVVETGVARGLTTRFVLEAMSLSGTGHLWSIDLPPPLDPELHEQVGAAVGNRFPERWTYIKGSSRRQLPGLLARLGQVDLFIHDSMHTEHNVRFELDRAWATLRLGGALVVDDVDLNRGFRSFTETFSGAQALVCQARPLQPDLRRFDGKGLFGIVRKESATENGAAPESRRPPA